MEKHFIIRKRYVKARDYKPEMEVITHTTIQTKIVKKAYVKCFGKLIPLSEEEIKKVEESIIIWM